MSACLQPEDFQLTWLIPPPPAATSRPILSTVLGSKVRLPPVFRVAAALNDTVPPRTGAGPRSANVLLICRVPVLAMPTAMLIAPPNPVVKVPWLMISGVVRAEAEALDAKMLPTMTVDDDAIVNVAPASLRKVPSGGLRCRCRRDQCCRRTRSQHPGSRGCGAAECTIP